MSDLVATTKLNGKGVYAVPVADTSVLFAWNKADYQKAGLDPNKGPATFDELFAQCDAPDDMLQHLLGMLADVRQAHGGDIRLDSSNNRGTQFVVMLPAGKDTR